jgi:hypothetical protein
VLEDVGHAGRVLRDGPETDQEDVVRVVGSDVEVLRAGLAMAVLVDGDVE